MSWHETPGGLRFEIERCYNEEVGQIVIEARYNDEKHVISAGYLRLPLLLHSENFEGILVTLETKHPNWFSILCYIYDITPVQLANHMTIFRENLARIAYNQSPEGRRERMRQLRIVYSERKWNNCKQKLTGAFKYTSLPIDYPEDLRTLYNAGEWHMLADTLQERGDYVAGQLIVGLIGTGLVSRTKVREAILFSKYQNEMANPVWTTQDKRELRYDTLDNGHLVNIARMLYRNTYTRVILDGDEGGMQYLTPQDHQRMIRWINKNNPHLIEELECRKLKHTFTDYYKELTGRTYGKPD